MKLENLKNFVELDEERELEPEDCPEIEESLKGLRIHPILSDIDELIIKCEQKQLPPRSAIRLVLGTAYRRRQSQRHAMQLTMARFPSMATFKNFEFGNIDPHSTQIVTELRDCAWIDKHENVLFSGASGLGKTHLSIALGRQAVAKGYRSLFAEANILFAEMRRWNQAGQLDAKLKNLAQVKLLIIDDIGYCPDPNVEDATLFYALIHSRYDKCSTIITTNRGVRAWIPAAGGDDTCMRAALDRFLHHCHILKLKGKSYRLLHYRQEHATELDQEADGTGQDEAMSVLDEKTKK